ncbi:MAG TPA: ABC transporter substrate-binding protein [Phototrophicaceae bacterium]|nr:ABC transporter substrate-binding protein [Phototrophicaceae bacterium]
MFKRSLSVLALAAMVVATSVSVIGISAQAATPMATSDVGAIDCKGAKQGDTVTVLYQWSGEEETHFSDIMKPLVDQCGIVIQPTSTRDQALLDTQVQAGTPPDIAFWTLAAAIRYKDQLQAMDSLGAAQSSYPDWAVKEGTVGGKWVALPVKTDIKTIVWYDPAVWDAKGYTVPTTWDDFTALVDKMAGAGDVPFSMGFESGDATGWTGQDFIEDIMLATKGPDYVQGLIDGTIPFNDQGVKDAWTIYGKWASDAKYTVGGAQGTLSTNFNDAIYKVFSDPPEAMMVKQSGFAGGAVAAKYPDLQYGTDYDFFPFPGAQGVQGGADLMLAFSNKPAVQALVSYLASPAGGIKWAEVGFDETPNLAGAGHYLDPQLQKKGAALAAAKGLINSIGDAIPNGFANVEWGGIVSYVNGGDLNSILDNLAAAQKEALSGVQLTPPPTAEASS